MQGQSKERKFAEGQQLNKNLLGSLKTMSHKRWAKVLAWFATLIFTIVMAVISVGVWDFIFTNPTCVQNGTCAPHYQPAPYPPGNPTPEQVQQWVKGPK